MTSVSTRLSLLKAFKGPRKRTRACCRSQTQAFENCHHTCDDPTLIAKAALSDLMRATGLGKGGIYRHFESKQELARDAFDHAWKLAMDTRFEGTQEIPDTVDRLIQVVQNFGTGALGWCQAGVRC